jgi:hypothetical protein
MSTKKIILATLLVITIVMAGFVAASLASFDINVKALGNDTFTRHPPTSNGSSSNNTFMAKTFQHAVNEVKNGK